jgi:MFS family permease
VTSQLFRLPDFRRLWFVGLTTFVVRWLDMLAIGLVAYQITGSALVVAMLGMLRLLPMGLFGAFLGAAAERVERRGALVAMVVASMASTLALAVLASLDALLVWHMAVASFVNGICWAADNPVRRTMIGDAVGAERMGSAMSLDAGTNNASRVLGPTLSGLLLAQFGVASVFWLGVILYAAGLVAALRIRAHAGPAVVHATSFIASMRDGIAHVRSDRRLIGVFSITIIFNVFGWPFTSMIPVIGTDYLQLGPKGVGLLASCDGAGGLVGAFIVAALARPAWYGHIYVGAVACYLATVIAFATAPVASVAAIALLLGGVSGVCFAVMQATLVYRNSPPEMRARLLGVLSVCIGTGPLGFFYLGFLADVLTPRVATVALAAQGMLALVFTRRYWSIALRS